jgi:hypothetical protein
MILVKLIDVLSKGLLFGVPVRTGQTMPMCFAQRVVSESTRVIDQSPCIYPHRTISSERPWTKVEQFITVEREVTKLSD